MTEKINSVEILNFKNIASASFMPEENHIILSGTNGSGKTSIFEAMLTALCGKAVLPDDPIRHGSESAQIKMILSDKSVLTYSITVKIQENDFVLKINPYGPDGQLLKAMEKPLTFLKKIFNSMSGNPQAFFNLKAHEQVQELYKVMPELAEKILQNKTDFEICQQKRSETLLQKKSIEGQLKEFEDVSSYPDTEMNVTEFNAELVSISEHNSKKLKLKAKYEQANSEVKIANNKMIFIEKNIAGMEDQISLLLNQIKSLEDRITVQKNEYEVQKKLNLNIVSVEIAALKEYNDFQEISSDSVAEKLMEGSNHNEKFKIKQRYVKLIQQMNEIEDISVHCLDEMKFLQAQKLEICRTSKMPIPGLAIGDDCLIYPDPNNTANMVNLNSLSTGQKWVVALALHSKLNPGCKILFVESLNDLDEKNRELLFSEAQKSGIQLILHNTKETGIGSNCDIIIKDSVQDLWG